MQPKKQNTKTSPRRNRATGGAAVHSISWQSKLRTATFCCSQSQCRVTDDTAQSAGRQETWLSRCSVCSHFARFRAITTAAFLTFIVGSTAWWAMIIKLLYAAPVIRSFCSSAQNMQLGIDLLFSYNDFQLQMQPQDHKSVSRTGKG